MPGLCDFSLADSTVEGRRSVTRFMYGMHMTTAGAKEMAMAMAMATATDVGIGSHDRGAD